MGVVSCVVARIRWCTGDKDVPYRCDDLHDVWVEGVGEAAEEATERHDHLLPQTSVCVGLVRRREDLDKGRDVVGQAGEEEG